MTNIRIMLEGECLKAKSFLSTQDAVRLVADLEDADFILQEVANYRAATPSQAAPETPAHNLTRRELEVLRLTAQGHSVRQAAAMLCLSAKTVDAHKVNLMRKLHIHNKAHLVQYAFRHRILHLEPSAEHAKENGFATALLN